MLQLALREPSSAPVEQGLKQAPDRAGKFRVGASFMSEAKWFRLCDVKVRLTGR